RDLCFVCIRPPLRSTLFPYTTLFRSWRHLSANSLTHRQAPGTCPRSPRRETLVSPGHQYPGAPWRELRSCRRSPDLGRHRRTPRSEEHTSELQSRENLVCRLLLEKKK